MNYADFTRNDVTVARATAVAIHRGQPVDNAARAFMNAVCEAMGPENFYMDGELFCHG